MLAEAAVGVAQIFPAVLDQQVDSDHVVLANRWQVGLVRSRPLEAQAADLQVWLPG
jgi:hypothetical protein